MIFYFLGVKFVRGGEVFEVRDEENVILNDPSRYGRLLMCMFRYSVVCTAAVRSSYDYENIRCQSSELTHLMQSISRL